ncbi:MAG TPA: hypothetical protein VNO22_09345 [Planctomycetota bacterium]|nr:hypothetical protein [Planctomycetota bacterium]
MRRIRRRRIREALRKAREAAAPRTPPPAGPGSPLRPQEVLCRCGKILKVTPEDCNQVFACPSCLRPMKVLRIAAPTPEGDVYRPVFFDEASSVEGELLREEPSADPNAETEVPSGATTVVGTVPSAEPDPPPRIYFACPSCGGRLAASRDLYDRRGRCSRCGVRLLISLVYAPSRGAFEIQLLRLGDAPSGKTRNVPAV